MDRALQTGLDSVRLKKKGGREGGKGRGEAIVTVRFNCEQGIIARRAVSREDSREAFHTIYGDGS